MTPAQTWLITGAGRGLGGALTLAALEKGHSVVATAKDGHSLPTHDRLRVHRLDVRDRSAAAAAVDVAVAEFGSLDVLVNNAGYGLVGAIEEATEEDVRSLLDTDLLGPLWLCQAAIPAMRKQGAGHIVQISTVGAVGTMPTLGIYNAAKWGLEGWTEAMAAEVAAFGIQVTIVQPGSIDTEWAGSSMRFSEPLHAYDDLRAGLFGTVEVPWPVDGTGGGTAPADIATVVLAHVADNDAGALRLLSGDDAPGQVYAALENRRQDYARDPRWRSVDEGSPISR